jgi:type I restriction enzyme R subunit
LFKKLNPNIPYKSAERKAFQKTINLGTEDIMENNERFHNHLTGMVEYTKVNTPGSILC